MPLVDDPTLRASIAAVVAEIVEAVDAADDSTIDGCCDRAVLHAYLASDDLAAADGAALVRATGMLATRPRAGLHGGSARIGWTLAHLGEGDGVESVLAPLDDAFLAMLAEPRLHEHDLISGLVGIGVYALERGDAGRRLASQVLAHLEASARPRRGGLAWYTPARQHWDLGMAHGSPGVIALCARLVGRDIEASRARILLDAGVHHLLACVPANPGGRYPAWQLDDGDSPGPRSQLAWCYGDLGVACALAAAARVEPAWREPALALALDCVRRDGAEAFIDDAGLCHGAAGVAHAFHRLAQTTGDASCASAARSWVTKTLAMRTALPVAGFPAFARTDRAFRADAGLLDGAAGVALALHATISEVDPAWDRLLLLDLAD